MIGNVSGLLVNGLSKNRGSVSNCMASNGGTVSNESERMFCYLLETRRRGAKYSSMRPTSEPSFETGAFKTTKQGN